MEQRLLPEADLKVRSPIIHPAVVMDFEGYHIGLKNTSCPWPHDLLHEVFSVIQMKNMYGGRVDGAIE